MRMQIVRRHVAPEMLALSFLELMLTFALALILLTPSFSKLSSDSVHFAVVCALTVCFIAFTIGLYRPQMFERAQSLLFNTVLSALLSFPAVWLVTKGIGVSKYWPVGYDPLRPLKIVVIWSLGVLCIRLLFLTAVRLDVFLHRVALVGSVGSPSVLAAVGAGRKGFLEISATTPECATANILSDTRVRTLVYTAENGVLFTPENIKAYGRRGIRVQTESDFWERYLRRLDIENSEHFLCGTLDDSAVNRTERFIIRTFDIVVSLALLLATLPIMCVVAAIVRFDSSGPVLYRQERVGLHGIPFILLKFRSMRADAEAFGPRWAQQKDPRVTRVGIFMRRTRIDELPQLVNILRGQMSFIGPRPERPHFVEQLNRVIPCYTERSRVKPGLTGWAQVNYPYGASVEDARAKLSYDLYYVKNRTVMLDLLILLSTVRVILLQEGAR